MSSYTIVLQKIDTCSCKKGAWKSAKAVGEDSGCESRGLHCVYRQKDNCIRTGSWWNCIFEKRVPSCPLQWVCISLTCLWVWACFVVAEPGLTIQYDTLQAHVGVIILSLAGKRPLQIKLPVTRIQYLQKCQVFAQQVTNGVCVIRTRVCMILTVSNLVDQPHKIDVG